MHIEHNKNSIAEAKFDQVIAKRQIGKLEQLLSLLPGVGSKASKPVIAVLRLSGVIGKVSSVKSGLSIESLHELIDKAFEIKNLKALCLTINSPGGSPVQSELISKRIRSLAGEKKIPIYSFVEDVAASGGYWLACIGDQIYASKSSIIGSIGVVSAGFGFPVAINKLGVERRVYAEGKNKSILDPFQIQSIGLEFHIGVDGISIFFVVLTSFLTLICIIASLFTVKKYIKEFLFCFLLIESFCIGAFCSMNLLLFYLFFEVILIPMYIIIGIWGGENKVYAAVKFFLYTFLGSVFFLLSLIYIYSQVHSFNMLDLNELVPSLTLPVQRVLWWAIFIAFAVKVPMLPFHTWLPDAHVQAPTAGSVILAGILLKLGAYGFLRVSLPMFPNISKEFAFYVLVLSIFAVIYGSLVALTQRDMKKMIAYSSIAHMGYVTGGIFSLTEAGIKGAIYQMISHGTVASALFLIIGTLYDRLHTKEIDKYGGVANKMPILATFFMIAMLGSIGLPGTSGFIGEFLSLVGIYQPQKAMQIFSICLTC